MSITYPNDNSTILHKGLNYSRSLYIIGQDKSSCQMSFTFNATVRRWSCMLRSGCHLSGQQSPIIYLKKSQSHDTRCHSCKQRAKMLVFFALDLIGSLIESLLCYRCWNIACRGFYWAPCHHAPSTATSVSHTSLYCSSNQRGNHSHATINPSPHQYRILPPSPHATATSTTTQYFGLTLTHSLVFIA